MGSFLRHLTFVAILLAPNPALATPITYTFTGSWGFHDPQVDTPDFWAAMATVCIGNGTPVTWALTIDEATGASLGSRVELGLLKLTSGASFISVDPMQTYLWNGPMGPPVLRYTPGWLQWDLDWLGRNQLSPPLQVGYTGRLVIGFGDGTASNYFAQYLGDEFVTLVSIERVPEPMALTHSVGFLALLAFLCTARRRIAHKN